MKSSFLSVVTATVAFSLTCQGSLAAQSPAGSKTPAEAAAKRQEAPAITVGVVDLTVMFEQSPLWQRLNKELKEKQKAYGEQIAQVDKRIDELKATAEQMPDSLERDNKLLEIDLLRQQKVGMGKLLRDQFDLDVARAQLQVYQVGDQAIAKVAADRGLTLVLRRRVIEPPSLAIDKMSPAEVLERRHGYEIQIVLYNLPTLDVTADVVKELRLMPDQAPAPSAGAANGSKPANNSGDK